MRWEKGKRSGWTEVEEGDGCGPITSAPLVHSLFGKPRRNLPSHSTTFFRVSLICHLHANILPWRLSIPMSGSPTLSLIRAKYGERV